MQRAATGTDRRRASVEHLDRQANHELGGQVLLFVLVLIASGGLGVVVWHRLPDSLHADINRLVIEVRILTRTYTLKHVVEMMRLEMLAGVLPSLTRAYVPNEMWFGLAPCDSQRWGGFGEGLVQELLDLISREVAARETFELLGDGQIHLHLSEDPDAEPGRPTFAAQVKHAPGPIPHRHDRDRPAARTRADVHGQRTKPMPTETRPAALDETQPVASAGGRWLVHLEGKAPIALIGEMIAGRDPRSDITISDPNVSRRHARFALLDKRVTIVDLDSANGTYVNEQPVKMAILEPGDVIRLGRKASIRIEQI